jgi:hypothetical protein
MIHKEINMSRTTSQHQSSFFHRLLSVSIFILIVLSLNLPGNAYAANPPRL